ncbi:hypothetical protein WMY93_004487 [Mugilogobius chulae]|uniref:CCHC-type domain-containing protein n=1 Tax=Mugilogobius chulae TaxID=88201 RepID=A0AAW0PYG7_9GOBI
MAASLPSVCPRAAVATTIELKDWVGISGSALKWFKSYLEDRKYFVEIGNCVSEHMALTCGVPQGSIFGPLLFNLYMLPLGGVAGFSQQDETHTHLFSISSSASVFLPGLLTTTLPDYSVMFGPRGLVLLSCRRQYQLSRPAPCLHCLLPGNKLFKNNLVTMNPAEFERINQALAETEKFKQAIAAQGALVGQHGQALKTVMKSIQELTAGVNQLGDRLTEVTNQLAALTIASPGSAPTSAQPSVPAPQASAPAPFQPAQPREPFIPTPNRYSGELGSCNQFLHQCMIVFNQQPLTYSTDQSKVAFIMSLLSGKASAWAVAIANSNSPACNTLDLFTAEMLKVFDHPLQGKEASNRLLSLRQGSGSVSTYSVDFRILAAECGWDDKSLQGIFFRGLSEDVKDQLAARDETDSLEELISLSIRLDNRLRERRRERTGRSSALVPSFQPRFSSHPECPSPVQEFASTAPQPPSSEEPMQLGGMRLSPEERQRRLRQGLCLYCGELGHVLRSCPTRPKDRARQPQEGRWPTSQLSFSQNLKRFIRNYSRVASPLTRLTSVKVPFSWSLEADAAFVKLKDLFCSAPVLCHPDPAAQFVVEVDASESGVGAVLSQRSASDQKLHPCAFFSRQLSPAKKNYDVGNRELLAVVLALKEWRHWLEGASQPFLVWSDHKNLSYLRSARRLNARQARWALFLGRFNFTLTYRPGSRNIRPDALSRQFAPASAAELWRTPSCLRHV